MIFSKQDWKLPLVFTVVLYVFFYLIFFLLPGYLINNYSFSDDNQSDDERTIRNHIILHEPLNAISPVGVGNWNRLIFPIKIEKLNTDLAQKIQNNHLVKNGPNVDPIKEVVLSDFINSENNLKGILSSILLRMGRLLFGIIQFLMIFFFLWMRFKYRRKSKESYEYELSNDIKSLETFISTFGEKNEFESYNIKTRIRELDGKSDESVLEPNDLLERNLAIDKVYTLENSIINDFNMKGKDSSLIRLDHVGEQLELSHENKMRWLEWALFIIPTVGFIGTVVGISDALGNTSLIFATSAEQAIPIISNKLSLAFDTTLLALLATALMYSWKRSLDNMFFNEFLHDFNSFNYSWIVSSYETDQIEKIQTKSREFKDYVSKLLRTFENVNSKLSEAIDASKDF